MAPLTTWRRLVVVVRVALMHPQARHAAGGWGARDDEMEIGEVASIGEEGAAFAI